MEAKLFLVSLWCGIYGLMLRGIRKQSWENRAWVSAAMNGLFWGTFAFLAGMLVASYRSNFDYSFEYGIRYFVIGMALGSVLGYFRSRQEDQRENMFKDNLEWADTGFSAILLASVVMFFIVQAFKIPSGSMRMTFVEGDHLFVNKFIYGIRIPLSKKKILPFSPVKNRDIVIFRFPSDNKTNQHYGKDFIKRVVAVAGQSIRLEDKKLFVDGELVDEPEIQHVDSNVYPSFISLEPEEFQRWWVDGEFSNIGAEVRDNFGPVVVPAGHVFVMGDNRDRSYDSRFWGPLPLDEIKDKALLKYWGPIPKHVLEEKPWKRFWPFARFRIIHP